MLCIVPHKGNAKANANPSETHYTLVRVAEVRQGWGTGISLAPAGNVKWHSPFGNWLSSFLLRNSHTYCVIQPFHSHKSWAGLSGPMFLEAHQERSKARCNTRPFIRSETKASDESLSAGLSSAFHKRRQLAWKNGRSRGKKQD